MEDLPARKRGVHGSAGNAPLVRAGRGVELGFRLPGQVVPRDRGKGLPRFRFHDRFLPAGEISPDKQKAMMKVSPWPNKKAMGLSAHGL
jgi:hypothetical protein